MNGNSILMNDSWLQKKEAFAYLVLTTLVICGLATSVVTAPKVVHYFGVNFPFSNLVFSILTYPIVDCICELWGKKVARQTLWLGLAGQCLVTVLIQLSIQAPYAPYWTFQNEYETILATGGLVTTVGLLAFGISQILDIFIYQRLKELSAGKWLWLRTNVSSCFGQAIDSLIFVLIVFHSSAHKFNILWGSLSVKIILSILMTPLVYFIVLLINYYLDSETLAFKPNGA